MGRRGYEIALVNMGGCFSIGRSVRAAVYKQYVTDYLRTEDGRALILFTEGQEFRQIRVQEVENVENGILLKFVSKDARGRGTEATEDFGGGGDTADTCYFSTRTERDSSAKCGGRVDDAEQQIYRNCVARYGMVGEHGGDQPSGTGGGSTTGERNKHGGEAVGVPINLTKFNCHDNDLEGNEVGAAEAEGVQGDADTRPAVEGGEAIAHVTFSDTISCLWEDGVAVYPLVVYENLRRIEDTDTESIKIEDNEEEMDIIVSQMKSIENDLKERLIVMKADM